MKTKEEVRLDASKGRYENPNQNNNSDSLEVKFGEGTKSILVRFDFLPNGYLRGVGWVGEPDVTHQEAEALVSRLSDNFCGRYRDDVRFFFDHLVPSISAQVFARPQA